MAKKSIYPQRSQEVENFFSQGRIAEKFIVVPIDFAKSDHTAQLCLGTGEFLLTKPLKIYNSPQGAYYLDKRIQRMCRKYHICKEDVLIGGEDPPAYVYNFIHHLRDHLGYSFVRVNAYEAKKFRTNTRASSDNLDLNGIVQSILNRRARDIAEFDQIYAALKSASRSRRKFVKEETAAKNRIHDVVNILFPEFLCESKTDMVPFSRSSLWLMEDNFSVIKVKRMRMDTLVKGLRKYHTTKSEETAKKLKAIADTVLVPPPDLIPYYSRNLSTKIEFLRTIQKSIEMEENEMARCLVQTPGCFLTSFPGIGVVLAGGISSEYGDPSTWRPSDRMASYAGIVPREKQTGGKDRAPVKGHLPMDCNHILKDWLLQAAFHVGTTHHPMRKLPGHDGVHRLMEHYQRIENNEGKSRLSTAKLLLRIARKMVLNERVYMPSEWLRIPPLPEKDLFEFLDCVNQSLDGKWKKYDLSGIDHDKNYLKKWKDYCDDLKENSSEKISVSASK